jgi:hypothetical protein
MTFDRYYRTLHAALTEIVRQHFDAPNPHVGMGKFDLWTSGNSRAWGSISQVRKAPP